MSWVRDIFERFKAWGDLIGDELGKFVVNPKPIKDID